MEQSPVSRRGRLPERTTSHLSQADGTLRFVLPGRVRPSYTQQYQFDCSTCTRYTPGIAQLGRATGSRRQTTSANLPDCGRSRTTCSSRRIVLSIDCALAQILTGALQLRKKYPLATGFDAGQRLQR